MFIIRSCCLVSLATLAAAQGIRLNEPLARPLGGDVGAALLTPDGTRAVYVADGDVDDLLELYSAPTDGSQAAVKLNAPLAPRQRVVDSGLRLSPSGARVLFQID